MSPGRPTSHAQRICSSAICGLVLNVISSGTPTLARRSSSSAHAFGRYSRYATGRLAWRLASDSVTATWQFACLPSCPQYWCDTPTECCPFLGRPVSSMIQASIGPSGCSHAASMHTFYEPLAGNVDLSTVAGGIPHPASTRAGRDKTAPKPQLGLSPYLKPLSHQARYTVPELVALERPAPRAVIGR